jgi:hypothetical protein
MQWNELKRTRHCNAWYRLHYHVIGPITNLLLGIRNTRFNGNFTLLIFLHQSFTKYFLLTTDTWVLIFEKVFSLAFIVNGRRIDIYVAQHVLSYWHIWARSWAQNLFYFDYLSIANSESFTTNTKKLSLRSKPTILPK